jgi:hypothetical protein
VQLLHEHRRRCVERAGACGVRLSDDAYVFSFDPGRPAAHAPILGDAPVLAARLTPRPPDNAARSASLRGHPAHRRWRRPAHGVGPHRPRRRGSNHAADLHTLSGGSRPASR